MKTYYCVTSSFHDSGRVTAAVTMALESEEKPQNTSRTMRDRDIYSDWYDNLDEANKAVAEARSENSEKD